MRIIFYAQIRIAHCIVHYGTCSRLVFNVQVMMKRLSCHARCDQYDKDHLR